MSGASTDPVSRRPPKPLRSIPHQAQTSMVDCGAACLTMVLGFWRKRLPLQDVRDAVGGAQGAAGMHLLAAGRHFGLKSLGVKVPEIDGLADLPRASILHWRFNHFVVLDRLTRHGADILDPAFGRRRVSRDELSRSFTGVAMVFEPDDHFVAEQQRPPGVTRYLGPMVAQAGHLGRIVTMSVLLQALALALPLLTAAVVDRVVPQTDRTLLWALTFGVIALTAYRFACALLRARLLLRLRTELDATLTTSFLQHLVNLPYTFFTQRAGGDLILRVSSNTTIRETLTSSMLSALLDGGLVSVYLIVLFWTDVHLGFLVLALGLLRTGVFLLTRRRYRELAAESLQVQSVSRSSLVEILAGIETLKAAGAQNRAVERWADDFSDELDVTVAQGNLQAWVDTALQSLSVLSPLIVLLVGAGRVLDGELTLGAMLAAGALAAGFLEPLSTLVTRAFELQHLAGTLERLNEVFDTPLESSPGALAPPVPLSGSLEVRDLSFRYDSSAPLAVDSVSLTVEPGGLVAIVGRSGSGKSTLGALLFGLYPPSDGSILYDGLDLAELDLDKVRAQLGIVTQRAYLFGHSIRANIALNSPDAALEQIVDAARKAQIHDDIMALPMGYETVLADGGATLSGGQRQRLAIARAILPRPRLLLLDEATSALDTVTEDLVHAELQRLRCTRIVIAHRLSTVADSDEILVMERGRLVERGDHATLLALGGHYAELVASDENLAPVV
ncbi:MAG: peptidase domain-containing ABC transporter [Acidobacteriota bacterium]